LKGERKKAEGRFRAEDCGEECRRKKAEGEQRQ
jgi:hypothetical protein